MLVAPTIAGAWPYIPELMRRGRVAVPSVVGEPEAAHLLRRVGFGYNERDAKQILGLPLATAVHKLLWLADAEPLALPAWADESIVSHRARFERLPQRAREEVLRSEMLQACQWWHATMATTSNPVLERMTLFWHGHFTSSWRKVGSAPLMLRQNMKWRGHALGNFADFVRDMVTDAAMVLYLDAGRSTGRAVDERFARALMEHFLLGNGFYFEADVRDAARALTGVTVRGSDQSFLFLPAMHDMGRKTIFGKTGNFDYRDVVRLILGHELCAQYVARKVAEEVVGPGVDEASVQEYAKAFRGGKYEIRELLRAILLSSEFWHPDHRGTIVKSPAVLTVELARGLGLPKESADLLVQGASEMGQDLMDPPSVRGWPLGKGWLAPQAAEVRRAFVARAMGASSMMYPTVVLEPAQMQALAQKHLAVPTDVSRMNGGSYAQFLQQLFESKEFQLS